MPMLNFHNYYLLSYFSFYLIILYHIFYKENNLIEISKWNYIINQINKI